ncbi:baseplate hub protein [Dyadobacter psychrotolerans]|uniref:Uncharacterized protein n=1 Tax=Dyadobacter psychrotolerans TaxID=2541721 RepID=A0A4R5DZT2_9BACT|nr:hypothetical protein [Dyadobacter psychrotolerans]TDE17721.1 hypothetical protein E0F88_07470 [Dyadobacter psychrotolerans]
MKFGRQYRLTLEMDDGQQAIIIEPPFTLQFSVERNALASLNAATLIIYNLSEITRGRILHDRFDTTKLRTVILEVGYETLATIFVGTIRSAGSMRQGSNIITTVIADDGGFDTTNTLSFETIQAGATIGDVVKTLIGDFPNVNQGVVSGMDAKLSRPVVLDGNTWEQIKKYTKLSAFIDLNKVHVIQDNEVIIGELDVIDSSTGLLETPRREESYLSVTTLLEPRIIIGQAISLESTIAPVYNGQYKVIGASHQGIISEAIGGQCQSRFSLLMGNQLYGAYKTVAETN